MSALSAAELLAAASEASGLPSSAVEGVQDSEVDLGHLSIHTTSSVDEEQLRRDAETYLMQMTQRSAQILLNQVFDLEATVTDMGYIVQLPPAVADLPRARPVPRVREQTTWEKFAAKKGIQKRKREKFVYDEKAGEYRQRFGREGYRVTRDTDEGVMEAQAGVDDFAGAEDPWTRERAAKRRRVADNTKQQVRNTKRAGRGAHSR
jgi:regulator of ribosome biosynthesis